MPEEIKDANTDQESSPVQDAEPESSTEQSQPEETPSQQVAEPEQPPFHEHPRFKELIEKNQGLSQMVQQLQGQVELLSKTQSPQKVQDEVDETLSGYDDQTKQWVKSFLQPILQKEISRAEKRATETVQRELNDSRKLVSEVIAERFIEQNPEIKKGSPEMQDVIKEAQSLAALGMPIRTALEKAKKITMFDKVGKTAVLQVKQQHQQKIEQKRAANIETSSVSDNIPARQSSQSSKIVMSEFEAAAKELGIAL